MVESVFFEKQLNKIIETALLEDVGDGDHSSLACIAQNAIGSAKLLVKDRGGIIAGVDFAKTIFSYIDSSLEISIFMQDGSPVKYGDAVLSVWGSSLSILKAERLVLNAVQRMSGIATKTACYVKLLKGTKAKLLDTRKTTPGIRILEKWAVAIGGGQNHRFGLYDMIMLKDSHIDFSGSIVRAIHQTKQYLKHVKKSLKIVVEARNLNEVKQILQCTGVYRILLDNFNYEETRKAVKMIGGHCQIESSGNISENTIREYALCGVDYISCGALTHSVDSMDLSLKVTS